MVVLNRIYTRTGDSGDTALGDGSRVAKTSVRVEAYGTVDEANAAIGLAALRAKGEMADAIARIQNDLFDLGADLCVPPQPGEDGKLRVDESQVERLESEIDDMNESLDPLTSFVLPGGSELAAALHMARAVSRRAERRVVALSADEEVGEPARRYLNRLSDWLFVAARTANGGGKDDVLWVPGGSRGQENEPAGGN